MKRDIVLFDLGNTLIYFDAEWSQVLPESNRALLEALHEMGLNVDQQDFLVQMEKRLQKYYQERETEFLEYTTAYILQSLLAEMGYPEVPDGVIRGALRAMYAVSQSHWQVEPDAASTLEALRTQGCRLGMISNAGDDQDVQTLVDKAGIRDYFDVILTSAAQGIRKPNPRLFHRALQRWEAAPAQAVMVGDTLGADILGARNAGIFSVWITRRANKAANQDHLETIQPDAQIAALGELLSLFNDM